MTPMFGWLFVTIILLILFYNIKSETLCPNNCNHQGTCDKFSRCNCFEGYEGGDCSLRSCPSGPAWGDKATALDKAHGLQICSGRGSCDRKKGLCICDEGFYGISCNLLDCVGDCNNRGQCLTMKEQGEQFRNEQSVQYTYTTGWDADRIYGCVCDWLYEGYDCSQTKCPTGDDPLTTGQINEVQAISCNALRGSFRLYFKGKATPWIKFYATAKDVKEALETVPEITNVYVTFSVSDSTACMVNGGNSIRIEFRDNFGYIPPLVYEVDATMAKQSDLEIIIASKGGTVVDTNGQTTSTQSGDKENLACTGRGSCETSDGTCFCYTYNGDAYGSSDGYGNPGTRGDCGYVRSLNPISTCPGETECSGHGICDKTGANPSYACTCAVGWTSGDCSARKCPVGRSWHDYPTANNVAHQDLAECSNMGECLRSIGHCVCRPGFFGQACEYSSCPGSTTEHDCNGHGLCLSMYDLSLRETEHLQQYIDQASFSFGADPNNHDTWEGKRIHSCLCDEGWFGHDCTKIRCPYGDDPFSYLDKAERQILRCTGSPGSGEFTLKFRGMTTSVLPTSATVEMVENALNELSTIEKLSVQLAFYNSTLNMPYLASKTEPVCASSGFDPSYMVIDYLLVFGNIPTITATATGATISVFSSGATPTGLSKNLTSWDGTTQNQECSNRGICDWETGDCECFSGYLSSDGVGNAGDRRDCGYHQDAQLLPPRYDIYIKDITTLVP